MKIFHTADWHLGKLVQGVYMTSDQKYILKQFIRAVKEEKPDAIIIAGDLYDRAVPPTEAIQLLDETLEEIVLQLKVPVLAIAGNHDSPSRLHFGSNMMQHNGFHIIGRFSLDYKPVILSDSEGDVHFHLVPYCDPSMIRNIFQDDEIRTHNQATEKIVKHIKGKMDPNARHVFVGHAFVTPYGEAEENTSDSERPLSIGGAEYVAAHHFKDFAYTALGHLHRAHYVENEKIRYSGSILKYSISEEHHKKGFNIVQINGQGNVSIEKRNLTPKRDMRTVETTLEDLLTHPVSEDYIFVKLTDETPILSPMEKVRSVYPNAMHVERTNYYFNKQNSEDASFVDRAQLNDFDLFNAFYKEVKGVEASVETEEIFKEVLDGLLSDEHDEISNEKEKSKV